LETQKLFEQVEALESEIVETLMQLIRVPAIGPENGGAGESAKAEILMRMLSDVKFDRIERYDAIDPRVPSGKRPNIVAYLNGETDSKRLWIVTHLDVVPAGEESLWKITKPFEPMVQNARVYGRGSEDNGQSLVASLFAVKALKLAGIKPKRTIALAFVSDEEQGSTMGIQYLISKGLFRSDDLVIVPDSGRPKGEFIEIAEKSILWLKLITFGKQSHGSFPNKGLNAHRIGMQVALQLDTRLHEKYNARDDYFDVPYSTFEPTRKDKNVDAVNIIPGEDVLYFDCRILPQYNLDEILEDIEKIKASFEEKTGAKIQLEILQRHASPPVSIGSSQIVELLRNALAKARGLTASVGGVGGGTCAAFFRNKGIPAVVWSTVDEIPHQPDEYSKIENIVEDAKIYALLATM